MALLLGRKERNERRKEILKTGAVAVITAIIFLGYFWASLPAEPVAVKYKWTDAMGAEQCEVRVTPTSTPRSCSEFSKEKLNQFPLDWTDPYRKK